MKKLFLAVAFVAAMNILMGCAAMSQIAGVIFGSYQEQGTKTPYWIYRSDLKITIDNVEFNGFGVTLAHGPVDIKVKSLINIDRVEVETCNRMNVCQPGAQCDKEFTEVDSGFFGGAGKSLTYNFEPSAIEKNGECPMYIRVFNKSALLSWGFIVFRSPDETLPSTDICNGSARQFAGHSVCNPKSGKPNQITFQVPIKEWDADPSCHMKEIDNKTFEYRPEVNLCTADFFSDSAHHHGLDAIGYSEVLVR